MKRFRRMTVLILAIAVFVTGGFILFERAREDRIAPEIFFDSDRIEVSVNATDEELLQGVTARDDRDGDVSTSLVVEKLSEFTAPGVRTITYGAFDSSNNVKRASRTLVYTDYTPPHFSLTGDLSYLDTDTFGLIDEIRATDLIDGDITDRIKVLSSDYIMGKAGTYDVTFGVTNSGGSTSEITLTLDVTEQGEDKYHPPRVALSEYLIYTKVGQTPDFASYVSDLQVYNYAATNARYVSRDVSAVKCNQDLDVSVPGIYTVTYSYTDYFDYTGTARMFVVVEE